MLDLLKGKRPSSCLIAFLFYSGVGFFAFTPAPGFAYTIFKFILPKPGMPTYLGFRFLIRTLAGCKTQTQSNLAYALLFLLFANPIAASRK